MHTQKLSIEEQHRNVVPIQSQKFDVLLFCNVHFFKPITSIELCLQFLHQIIAQRAMVVGVKR